MCIHMTGTETVTLLGRAGRNLKDGCMYAAHIVYLLLCNQRRLVDNMYLDTSRIIRSPGHKEERKRE